MAVLGFNNRLIKITWLILFLVSLSVLLSVGWVKQPSVSGSPQKIATEVKVEEVKVEQKIEPEPAEETLKDIVRRLNTKYETGYSDTLVLEIIRCESSGEQSARNYNAVVGVDVGLFQLNTYYHLKSSQKKGLDIYTQNGNLEYGFGLLKTHGTTPWNWSKHCWLK